MNLGQEKRSSSSVVGSASQKDELRNIITYLSSVDTPSQKIWELLQFFRAETRHEHALLLGRVSWYMTCQSFLITVYAVTYSNAKHPNWFSNFALPALAIIVSILAYYMIDGATQTINMWGDLRNHLLSASTSISGQGLDPVMISRWRTGGSKRDIIHRQSLWFPQFIALVFIFFGFLFLLPHGSILGCEASEEKSVVFDENQIFWNVSCGLIS